MKIEQPESSAVKKKSGPVLAEGRELRHRRARNVRDYGMFERGEATQYFPEAKCPMGMKP